MASDEDGQRSIEHLSQGLDRAPYNVYHNPERHLVSPLQPEDLEKDSTSSNEVPNPAELEHKSENKLRRISKRLTDNVRTKSDIIFHPAKHKPEKSADSTTVPTLAPPPKESENDRLFHDAPEQKGPDFKEVVKNPVSTVKSAFHGASGAKFAETMDNQVIAHGAEVRLVRAYDDLVNAESERDKVSAADNLEELKKARQDSFVRWTMDRHVLTVRRVPPRSIPWPRLGDFNGKREDGKKQMKLVDYGHHVGGYILLSCLLER